METLYKTASNPSGLDSYANYAGETPSKEWLVVVTRSRDSDALTEANWQAALELLGGEGEHVAIHRFGHWACGWWEALCVAKDSDKEAIGLDIEKQIEAHPVLDEELYSELEMKEADRHWECLDTSERVQHLRTYGHNFETFGELLECVRADYAPWLACGYEGLTEL